jgi:hypothetical protein
MKKLLIAIAFCLVTFLAGTAFAAAPEKHEEYMKNEDYKGAFDQFALGMEEARERLTPEEYKNLERKGDEVIAVSVKEDMESDTSESDAYETAYWMRYEQVSMELRHDWLRKNAEDAQGFYRLKSASLEGYLTLEKGDEDGVYAVVFDVVMKNDAQNSGSFEGPGKLSGSKMTAPHDDDENAVSITFDGETAIVETSRSFKESGWLGAGVTIDGEYVREKR